MCHSARDTKPRQMSEDKTILDPAAQYVSLLDDLGSMEELLDRPYIDRHVGLDFFVMIIMGVVLGLLSIPYCVLT